MRRVSNYMAGIRGRRKALVLFSEGLDFNTDDVIGPRQLGRIRPGRQRDHRRIP